MQRHVDTAPPLAVTQGRPAVLGKRHMVSSCHYLASLAGLRMFPRGGNAIDAGVAAGIALNVVEPNLTSLGGVAPIMIFTPGMAAPVTIDGLGRAPAAATLATHLARFGRDMNGWVPRVVVPAALDAWLTALARFGRLTLAEVLTPSIELADGFPVHPRLSAGIARAADRLREWPSSAAAFLPHGRPPQPGEVLAQRDLAALLRRFVAIEHAHASRGREAAIFAARDAFYRGDIAREISSFVARAGGLLTYDDIASYRVSFEEPAHTTYRGYDVFATGAWSQGPVVPMTLNILERFDLVALGHSSADHLHVMAEALKLAFADREAYVGDPALVDVPLRGMLSKQYAGERRGLIDLGRAALPAAGDPWRFEGRTGRVPRVPQAVGGGSSNDTSYVCAVDHDGNAFSATPSDSALGAPLVPGLGVIVSTRGAQFWLDEGHPSVIAPRKRPRLTPNPAMALRDGKVFMAFGCPGEDAQPQGMVQVLSNIVDFGMNVQAAIEAPREITWSFPRSFWPHEYLPGFLGVESRVPAKVREELRSRGHDVHDYPDFTPASSGVCAITVDGRGTMAGGADPRRESLAVGW
ncbi:MAG: gamma-glutamyltransferase [Chloroflexi bacterium 13_1_40CM_4_68_4]|nr:MAG: gamma-glutamyltransferase [Chloroflexi bacterium 13_1_40CM_4_68_4]